MIGQFSKPHKNSFICIAIDDGPNIYRLAWKII